jgi:hypothetical protein
MFKFIQKILVVFLFGIVLLSNTTSAQKLESANDYWNGQEMWYNYANGMSFHVKFEEAGMSYQALSKSSPEVWWGPFPYKSTLTANGEYLLSWYEKGYGDYVTLLIDVKNKTLYGSALIIVKDQPHTHFQSAVITKIGKLQ